MNLDYLYNLCSVYIIRSRMMQNVHWLCCTVRLEGGAEITWRYLEGLSGVEEVLEGRGGMSLSFWKSPGRYLEGPNSLLGIPPELLDILISIHYRSRHLYSSDRLLCCVILWKASQNPHDLSSRSISQAVSSEKGAPFADHLAGTRTLSNNRQVRWPSSWHDKQSMIRSSMNLQLHCYTTQVQKVVG